MKAILTIISLLIVLMAHATPIKIKLVVDVKTSVKDSVKLRELHNKHYHIIDAPRYGNKYHLTLIKY